MLGLAIYGCQNTPSAGGRNWVLPLGPHQVEASHITHLNNLASHITHPSILLWYGTAWHDQDSDIGGELVQSVQMIESTASHFQNSITEDLRYGEKDVPCSLTDRRSTHMASMKT